MNFQERVRRRNEFDASMVYGTKKFNIMTGRDKHVSHRDENDDQWINPETGLIHDNYAGYRNCPLCDADSYDTVFIKSGFPHVRCIECELVYVTPILSREEYEKLWEAEDSWESILENEHQIRMQALEANYSIDVAGLYLDHTNGNGLRICDVGCGPGTLLDEANKRGYDVMGIEPNKRCHARLAEKHIDFIGDFFPLRQDVSDKFDCLFMLNVLEHMQDPLQIVFEAKQLLKPSGLLYLSVPNIDAFVNRIMHEKAGVFGGHSHVQFFNKKTLGALMETTGFEILEYETIITELGVIKNYLDFDDPYFGDTSEKMDYITPEMIYRNHLARNINMVGRLK